LDAARVGEVALAAQIVLHELTPQKASLEEAFMELTQDSVEFHGDGGVGATTADAGAGPGAVPAPQEAPT
jgi:ABC-2 type transport system ATP-binding protein